MFHLHRVQEGQKQECNSRLVIAEYTRQEVRRPLVSRQTELSDDMGPLDQDLGSMEVL